MGESERWAPGMEMLVQLMKVRLISQPEPVSPSTLNNGQVSLLARIYRDSDLDIRPVSVIARHMLETNWSPETNDSDMSELLRLCGSTSMGQKQMNRVRDLMNPDYRRSKMGMSWFMNQEDARLLFLFLTLISCQALLSRFDLIDEMLELDLGAFSCGKPSKLANAIYDHMESGSDLPLIWVLNFAGLGDDAQEEYS